MTILTGTRVILRLYQPDDAQILIDATNDPVVRRLTGTQQTFTLDQIQRYITNSLTAEVALASSSPTPHPANP